MLKKTFIFSILGAFVLQAIVFNLVLYTFTLLAKYEEKTGNAQWIEFTEEQYSKLKLNETEFTYHNNMYDVVTSKNVNGKIQLLCKMDAKEKDLLDKLIEGFKHSKTKKVICFSFLAELNLLYEFKIQKRLLHTQTSTLKSKLLENSLEHTIPPPKA